MLLRIVLLLNTKKVQSRQISRAMLFTVRIGTTQMYAINTLHHELNYCLRVEYSFCVLQNNKTTLGIEIHCSLH
jgi:hypothetical protein